MKKTIKYSHLLQTEGRLDEKSQTMCGRWINASNFSAVYREVVGVKGSYRMNLCPKCAAARLIQEVSVGS